MMRQTIDYAINGAPSDLMKKLNAALDLIAFFGDARAIAGESGVMDAPNPEVNEHFSSRYALKVELVFGGEGRDARMFRGAKMTTVLAHPQCLWQRGVWEPRLMDLVRNDERSVRLGRDVLGWLKIVGLGAEAPTIERVAVV